MESKPQEWSKELIVALFVRGIRVFSVERQNALNCGDNTLGISLLLAAGLPDALDIINPRPFGINLDRTLVPQVQRAIQNLQIVDALSQIRKSDGLIFIYGCLLSLFVESNEIEQHLDDAYRARSVRVIFTFYLHLVLVALLLCQLLVLAVSIGLAKSEAA